MEVPVRLRARITFQSDQHGCWLRLQAELCRGALLGVEAPEIEGELASDSDDGFLPCGARDGSPLARMESRLRIGGY
jgi:hypothetical protein